MTNFKKRYWKKISHIFYMWYLQELKFKYSMKKTTRNELELSHISYKWKELKMPDFAVTAGGRVIADPTEILIKIV